jgi:predicted amidophosphoribosyltransferase
VFDTEREKEITLLSTGYACFPGEPPFEMSGDSTAQRYVVDGEMCQCPHDYCPKCWGDWDFKFKFPECPECGAKLGEDVKLLLDTDVCPYCEEGKVTMNQPVCSECGYELDPTKVVWG